MNSPASSPAQTPSSPAVNQDPFASFKGLELDTQGNFTEAVMGLLAARAKREGVPLQAVLDDLGVKTPVAP